MEGTPSLWLLWLFGFSYALVMAVVLQKLVMPIMPGLHAGQGLLNHDAVVFHEIAAAMADRIRSSGWSEWTLIPGAGITANVGILAALYSVFGADPLWFLPLNAGFHALGALLVMQLGRYLLPDRQGWAAGGGAALLFLVYPSALVWYAQNHKDAFLIVGYLLSLYAFVRALDCLSFREMVYNLVMMIAGCVLVFIMRPHLLLVYAATFSVVLSVAALWKLIRPSFITWLALRNSAVVLGVMAIATIWSPKNSEIISMSPQFAHGVSSTGWQWKTSGLLPDFVENKLETVSFIRAYFIETGRSAGSGSTIDDHVTPETALELGAYIPRAFWIGLLAPFPDTWLERPTVPRIIGAVETAIFYLLTPGILILIWRKPSIQLFFLLAASAAVITVLSYTSPNVGTLHRIRYGPLFIFMVAGAAGWVCFLRSFSQLLVKTRAASHEPKNSDRMFCERVSGKSTIVIGAMVALISIVGSIGLLIRDLILINGHHFGVALDSFYLAMMIPMLLVSILSVPLGDVFLSAVPRMQSRAAVQSLLGSVATLSLVVFGILSTVLFLIGEPVYQIFLTGQDMTQILALLPVAILIYLLSGLLVIGNSLLAYLDKSTQAAAAQLIVPATTIMSLICFSSDYTLILVVSSMFAGQILNLIVLFMLARKLGYCLLPSAIIWSHDLAWMLSSYFWIVAAGFVAGLSIPWNFWMASQLAVGTVSIWAIGSKFVQTLIGIGSLIMSTVWLPYVGKLLISRLLCRLRQEVYLSLLLSTWGGGLLALAIFWFSESAVAAAMPVHQDEVIKAQLAGVIQLGALQLPFLASSLVLVKLSIISAASWKVLCTALAGFLVNMVVGYIFLPIWGVFGIAAAWGLGVLLSTAVMMLSTRVQSMLGWNELIGIFVSWLALGMLAGAIYLKSSLIAILAISASCLVIVTQVKNLIKEPTTQEIVIG